jgi:hypothetical protein
MGTFHERGMWALKEVASAGSTTPEVAATNPMVLVGWLT